MNGDAAVMSRRLFEARQHWLRSSSLAVLAIGVIGCSACIAQEPPYDTRPEIAAPFHRVRYEAGTEAGALVFPATFTVWIPPGVERLRGVVVHQHGCGTGSCSSGLTAAHDLHWQALAAKHDCALLAHTLTPAADDASRPEATPWERGA